MDVYVFDYFSSSFSLSISLSRLVAYSFGRGFSKDGSGKGVKNYMVVFSNSTPSYPCCADA